MGWASGGLPALMPGRNRTRAAQARDRVRVKAQLAQNLIGVFADVRRATRSHFRLLVQAHRAVDGQTRLRTAVVHRHEDAVGKILLVAGWRRADLRGGWVRLAEDMSSCHSASERLANSTSSSFTISAPCARRFAASLKRRRRSRRRTTLAASRLATSYGTHSSRPTRALLAEQP